MHLYRLTMTRRDADGVERTGSTERITAASEEDAEAAFREIYPRPLPEGYTEEIEIELLATLGSAEA